MHYLAGYCFRAMKALPLILLFTYPLGRRGHGRLVVRGMERLVPLCLCLCCCSCRCCVLCCKPLYCGSSSCHASPDRSDDLPAIPQARG